MKNVNIIHSILIPSDMKKLYSLLGVATALLFGGATANARFWTYNSLSPVSPSQLEVGKPYVIQPGIAANAGANYFLAGSKFSSSLNLTEDALFYFERVPESTGKDGNPVYYLKRSNGEYLALPDNKQFFTNTSARAWPIQVKEVVNVDKDFAYDYVNPETGASTHHTGMNAYIWQAKENEDPTQIDLSSSSYLNVDAGVVIVARDADNPDDAYSTYKYLLSYPEGSPTSEAGRATDYARNAWVIYEATPQDYIEGLRNLTEELTGGLELDEKFKNYVRGEAPGTFSAEKYALLTQLWNRAQAILGGAGTSNDEIDALCTQLSEAYTSFTQSGRNLEAGYYVFTNLRNANNSKDHGALYDGSAVNASRKLLQWTYQGSPVSYTSDMPVGFDLAKFVWHVTPDAAHPGLFFFQNLYTGNYIGAVNQIETTIPMTTDPQESYNVVVNPDQPGFFSFYSPKLFHTTAADFGGLHTSGWRTDVVGWDWRTDGSSWHVRSITDAEAQSILAALAQPKLNIALENLAQSAEASMEKGYSYAGFDANGQKIAHTTTGELPVEGLVTSPEQLDCPMFDIDEGVEPNNGIGTLLDNNTETYFHSSWHSGANAWKGDHYLQMTLAEPEHEVLARWAHRIYTSNTALPKGAPVKVEFWGTNDPAMLDKKQEEGTSDTGETAIDYNAWQKYWTKLGSTSFQYKYDLTVTGNTTVIPKAIGNAHITFPGNDKYKFLRMTVLTRVNDSDKPNGNVYFHGSEFRLYKGGYDQSTSIIASVPADKVKALNDLLAQAHTELDQKLATQATIDALQKAYDDFLANYPDPTRVTTAIAEAKTLAKTASEGSELGYYQDGAADALNAVIGEVENELNAIVAVQPPTVEEVNRLLAKLNAGLDAFNAKLNVPTNGIYRIISNSSNVSNVERLMMAYNTSRKENVRMGGRQKNGDVWEDMIGNEDRLNAYWKVEKVEGGYTYRNLFTGLYLVPVKGKDAITQREEPYTFALQYAKFPGCFNLVIDKADAYSNYIYANAQPNGNFNLVTWGSATGQDNSAFRFEKVEPTLENGFLYDLEIGNAPQIITFPIAVESDGNFYSVIGQDADNNIQLKKETGNLEAGRAYVYVPADKETIIRLLPVTRNVTELTYAFTPTEAVNGLMGTFETVELPLASGKFDKTHSIVLLSEQGESAAAGTGYFSKMPTTTEKGDYTLRADGLITALNDLVTTPTTGVDSGIYTLSGIRLRNAKHLPAGVYLMNGRKVVVR